MPTRATSPRPGTAGLTNGVPAAAGVYFYTLVNDNSKITRKLLLLQ